MRGDDGGDDNDSSNLIMSWTLRSEPRVRHRSPSLPHETSFYR